MDLRGKKAVHPAQFVQSTKVIKRQDHHSSIQYQTNQIYNKWNGQNEILKKLRKYENVKNQKL